jgi:hypothetical protein
MVDLFTALGWTSALSVIVPGIILLTLIRGVKVASLRNLTIMLSLFAILHGFYHISFIFGLNAIGTIIDLVSALILVMIGMYYSNRVIAVSLFALALPDSTTFAVPIVLVVALVVFSNLAFKSKSLNSLQAQLSIFLIIWTVAEILRSLITVGIISATYSTELFGLEVHTAAMVAFGFFIVFRYFKVARRAGNIPGDWLPKTNTRDISKKSAVR